MRGPHGGGADAAQLNSSGTAESEEVFFDENKAILRDHMHSAGEERLILIGETKVGRLLFVVFTKRGKRIRVISAWDVNRKELHLYEKTS